jgi:hypothetical protein
MLLRQQQHRLLLVGNERLPSSILILGCSLPLPLPERQAPWDRCRSAPHVAPRVPCPQTFCATCNCERTLELEPVWRALKLQHLSGRCGTASTRKKW